jgi:pyruvate,water dikinase
MALLARILKALGGSTAPEQLVREQYREFQRLLEANDLALQGMAALSELLARKEPFTHGGAARLVNEVLENARQMVASLVCLAGGRYAVLHRRLDAIAGEAHRALIGVAAEHTMPWTSFTSSPVYHRVSTAAASIIPLELTDSHVASFAPQRCRTAHDITRFCHEMAIREMFEVNDNQRHRMRRVRRLAFTVPLETFVIDLGGGLAAGASRHAVQPEDVTSVPFRALIAGMSTPGLRWSGAVPIELRGFAGLVLNTMLDTERASAELGSDAYALVSGNYVNYSARMGYHFASLDAYASASLQRNYISYRFKGGAADSVRRARRARFIAHVLRHWGFAVTQQADRIDATIRKLAEPDILVLLRELGRLLGAARNADVSMYCDEQIVLYAEAFLAGACSPVEATRGKLGAPVSEGGNMA